MKKLSNKNQFENRIIIDKTKVLEERLKQFPSIYISAAAVSGKTTAVELLLQHHLEMRPIVMDMKVVSDDKMDEFLQELKMLAEEMKDVVTWLVFENFHSDVPKAFYEIVFPMIEHLENDSRVIFVSREKVPAALLELLWKRNMDLVTQDNLRFTPAEVVRLLDATDSKLKAIDIHIITKGWAGCVDMLIRMSCLKPDITDVDKLRSSYEFITYIRKEIVASLSIEEWNLLLLNGMLPWMNEQLCKDVWGVEQTQDILESLERKGILTYDSARKCWRPVPLFDGVIEQTYQLSEADWRKLAEWYEHNGHIRDAINSYLNAKDESLYEECLIRYFNQVPFLNVSYSDVIDWKEHTPQICYLRGMYYYLHQNFNGLYREIERIEKQKDPISREVLLNLLYVSPKITLDEWLVRLSKEAENKDDVFHLYHMLGDSASFLCGLRDLTELFACTKREENHKSKIWYSCLGRQEWYGYQLARVEYYLETERINIILEEDRALLTISTKEAAYGLYEEQYDLAGVYLLGKLRRLHPSQGAEDKYYQLRNKIHSTGSSEIMRKVEAIANTYSALFGKTERLITWLRQSENAMREYDYKNSYLQQFCMAKGYMLINQYDKAEKILRTLIPYMVAFKKLRYLAEAWFMQAIVCEATQRRGQALQNMIESFLISSQFRYVDFYTNYGRKGMDVLELYMEWHQLNQPESWTRKKKYQYGNVLKMPLEDYLGVIVRNCRKHSRKTPHDSDESMKEHLTMMELLILQNIGNGLSNSEIGEKLNLKLPTVKTHLYNLYKKFDVDNRVQAIIKGKELGILE